MMSGWQFYGNIVRNVSTGVLLNGGRRNFITNNSFFDCDLSVHFEDVGMQTEQVCKLACSVCVLS